MVRYGPTYERGILRPLREQLDIAVRGFERPETVRTSLCTIGDDAGAIAAVERDVENGAAAALVVWDALDPPLPERMLLDAFVTAGLDATAPRAFLTDTTRFRRDLWRLSRLSDVARFDGFSQLWTALVLERQDALGLADAGEATLTALRQACAGAADRFTAADGTLRIPVAAVLCTSRAAPERR